jgi:hypothetical protein
MTPSTLGDVEVLEQLDFQPEIPCHIAPDARSMWCATTADHSAEFAVLTDCGHVYYYCAGVRRSGTGEPSAPASEWPRRCRFSLSARLHMYPMCDRIDMLNGELCEPSRLSLLSA